MSLESQLHAAADNEFDPIYSGLFVKFEKDFANLINGYEGVAGPIQIVRTFTQLRFHGSSGTDAKSLYEAARNRYREKFIAQFIEKAREVADIVDSLPQ